MATGVCPATHPANVPANVPARTSPEATRSKSNLARSRDETLSSIFDFTLIIKRPDPDIKNINYFTKIYILFIFIRAVNHRSLQRRRL
jgi:hypothetical protein